MGNYGTKAWLQPVYWASKLGESIAFHAAAVASLFVTILAHTFKGRVPLREVLDQAYVMGAQSLPLVLLTSALTGVVTAQQGGYQFTGAFPLYLLGTIVASSVILELGPLMTAFVLIGRVGARITAEIGTMRVSEQVDALLVLGQDPVRVLAAPRLWAGVLVTPLLVGAANAIGILSGLVAARQSAGLSGASFLYGVRLYWRSWDLVYSLSKAVAFGFVIPIIAVYMGFTVRGGAAGVGRATTTAVVAMMVAVLALDALFPGLLLQ